MRGWKKVMPWYIKALLDGMKVDATESGMSVRDVEYCERYALKMTDKVMIRCTFYEKDGPHLVLKYANRRNK